MAYCPLLRTYGGRERHTESLLVFHLRLRASILQFPVWAYLELPGTALQRSLTPLPLLTCCYSISLSISLFLTSTLPPCLCIVTISMLRTSKALPGHQSLRRPVSCLTVSQSVGWSVPRLALLLNYSFNCSVDGSATYSLSHSSFIFPFSLFCLYSHLARCQKHACMRHIRHIRGPTLSLYLIPSTLKWTWLQLILALTL